MNAGIPDHTTPLQASIQPVAHVPAALRGHGALTAPLKFVDPVDVEHKALHLHLRSWARPHMRAFHVWWIVLFTAFVSTFAPAALLPVIREDLDMHNEDIGNAGKGLLHPPSTTTQHAFGLAYHEC